MRITTFCISLLFAQQLIADVPECPAQPTREKCLHLAQTNYIDRLKFLEEDNGYQFVGDDRADNFLMAANDVRHFETQSCHKTCVN